MHRAARTAQRTAQAEGHDASAVRAVGGNGHFDRALYSAEARRAPAVHEARKDACVCEEAEHGALGRGRTVARSVCRLKSPATRHVRLRSVRRGLPVCALVRFGVTSLRGRYCQAAKTLTADLDSGLE
jgi:hypothetical protein